MYKVCIHSKFKSVLKICRHNAHSIWSVCTSWNTEMQLLSAEVCANATFTSLRNMSFLISKCKQYLSSYIFFCAITIAGYILTIITTQTLPVSYFKKTENVASNWRQFADKSGGKAFYWFTTENHVFYLRVTIPWRGKLKQSSRKSKINYNLQAKGIVLCNLNFSGVINRTVLELARQSRGVFYNRVPKCGSTTMIDLIRRTMMRNNFAMVRSRIYHEESLNSTKQKEFLKGLSGNLTKPQQPWLTERHLYFVDFERSV